MLDSERAGFGSTLFDLCCYYSYNYVMTTDNNFPMIYCNGDSYSDCNYHPTLVDNTYVNVVATHFKGFAINSAISGSCNRRIIRTTLHDMILERKLNPDQQIIALIGLSFEIRSELWIDNMAPVRPEDSNFKTHSFSRQLNWRQNLLSNKSLETPVTGVDTPNTSEIDNKFYDKLSQGRAYFYSPYAERINLLADLIMLISVLNSLNVKFLIFQAVSAEKLENEYLLDFFKDRLKSTPGIFDLETFGFANWCYDQKITPLDHNPRVDIGHANPEGHREFAEQVLIPKLKELYLL
jgi:hypothetical protein